MPALTELSQVLQPTAALLRTQIAVSAAIDGRAVAPSGLDPTTSDLLLRISISPQQQVRAVDLCRQLQLSPSHVSRRLDRAIDRGLVQRSPDPGDRRAHIITLTEAGRAALDDFMPRLVEVVGQVVFDNLSADEVRTLVDLLRRIEAAALLHPEEG